MELLEHDESDWSFNGSTAVVFGGAVGFYL